MNGHILYWRQGVLSEEDLRRNLNGHRTVVLGPKTVVTPLANEHLRAAGVRLERQENARLESGPTWGYAQSRLYLPVATAILALAREGIVVAELSVGNADHLCQWTLELATRVARGEFRGEVLFCEDPGLSCCVANKIPGLRAAAVTTVEQSKRAARTLNANLIAVEMPGTNVLRGSTDSANNLRNRERLPGGNRSLATGTRRPCASLK